ncbi:DNA mismatch repair endonuclease MutL [Aliiglaciecola sp. LCG003]|uniref:DNA mismatch repair endonuclease MutL n=1 Tax=Aliiglaciecola sp. LCG003 TaxID=3053655 RepID=UPI0025730228|nr:DNA mismatch repair endonuclease MutL [Aliiglaciecola sp. LCG003]WJG09789.1 DNA mismatch repair endonuclease MutL [Aliiglaciecola sp. LCG003]
MAIQILSTQLANQIAAGEVVERPASVVKELVENSIDAGAKHIDVEIDKGGHKRICIRDNGSGIEKTELQLALSRHATSKISQLDDLENIQSLGFRGEALASISSVSRLTLTSKPANQQEAWQACAEGRDMQVTINPAAHPDGTSIEVVDLFFNTPARRKFLRAEKTEFNHIEEIIKRIALSRFDVGITLKHNGKVVRKFPAIGNHSAPIKRISAVCGNVFAENSVQTNSQYEGMKLTGWLSTPGFDRPQNDLQYFYVNGRVMRDKLINHAIRQAYEGLIDPNSHAAFVLYLDIDPHQVDVNVHPAKHEVRFHQSRLVHDFIFRCLSETLNQSFQTSVNASDQDTEDDKGLNPADSAALMVPVELATAEPAHDYIRPLDHQSHLNPTTVGASTGIRPSSLGGSSKSAAGQFNRPMTLSARQDNAAQNYQRLMQSSVPIDSNVAQHQWLALGDKHVIFNLQGKYLCCEAVALNCCRLKEFFASKAQVKQPLLMPVSMDVSYVQWQRIEARLDKLAEMGFEFSYINQRILLKQVPAGLRQLNWSGVITNLFNEPISQQDTELDIVTQFIGSIAQIQLSAIFSQEGDCKSLIHWLFSMDDWQHIVSQNGKIIALQEWINNLDE